MSTQMDGMSFTKKIRLDQLLVDQHGYENKSRARDTILRGCVVINGEIAAKPGQNASPKDIIKITDEASPYVSRAALKLKQGLQATGYNPSRKIALDLGASTGGFTQVLLENDAKHVWCIDVGSGQLHPSLLNKPKLTNIENLNVRDLTPQDLDNQRIQFLVSDLSFISLKIALPVALDICASGCEAILLVKPQFEVGKDNIGKGGLVKSPEIGEQAAHNVADWLDGRKEWQVSHFMPSPIKGGDGNSEFLLGAKKV